MDIQKPELTWWNVTGASTFVLIAAAVSLVLGTKLELSLIISGLRCVLQLSLMGLVLDDVLSTKHMSVVIIMSIVFVLLGSYETVFNRTKKTFKGMFPIMFVILFNIHTCNCSHAPMLETRLSFGATRYEAGLPLAVEAIRLALLPVITQLSVMGMVNIPGLMTGQIMAGTPIMEAVLYQQCIMFMIAASSTLGVIMSVTACMSILIDKDQTMRQDRIMDNKSMHHYSRTEHDIQVSDYYTSYPTGSNFLNSPNNNHKQKQDSLPLYLTKPVLVQVYNYGPDGSKVDIYNYHKKIGEAGSYNLTAFNNNNIGIVYLSKGDHSLSLQPYYKQDSLSTHFVKVHISPKSPSSVLKKRDPVFNNANKYVPEHNAYVQWEDDSVPKSHQDDEDEDDDDDDDDDEVDDLEDDEDDEDEDDHGDDADDDKSYQKDAGMDGHWWKWHKEGGWKMGKKKKVIYISTVNYSEPTTPAPITVTSTATAHYTNTVHHTSIVSEPPTPSPLQRMVTATVFKTGPTETVQIPGITKTVNKVGPTETSTVTVNAPPAATVNATVILPVLLNTVTEYRDIREITTTPITSPIVESNRIVTVTAPGSVTTINGAPIAVSNSPVTVTMNGQITTIFPDPITVTNDPVTVTNDPQTIVSTVNLVATHFLLRQTVVQTVVRTDTAIVTVGFTSHNAVYETVGGTTSTKTENVLVTVYHTRSSTVTATPTSSIVSP
ncbi:hypothetical protein MFLAVUS_001972 [Mucor flavus]|uniref:Uncharacterized protein n=1 Tax=Mucor flavus TaxID=439312 RepID=A0ABP9YP04_9FUNG